MAAYRRVYDSRHLQVDCQERGSAPEPYARQSSTSYLYLHINNNLFMFLSYDFTQRHYLRYTNLFICNTSTGKSVDSEIRRPNVAYFCMVAYL